MKLPKEVNDKMKEQIRHILHEFPTAERTRSETFDAAVLRTVDSLTPLQIGLMLHPGCRGIALADVPASVLEDHRRRYTDDDLREGQFIVVIGSREHFVFIMGHETKKRKDRETTRLRGLTGRCSRQRPSA
jgi:hypothetical protein